MLTTDMTTQQVMPPDRDELRGLYDQAIAEVNATRSSIDLTKGFYAENGNSVFDAAYLALTDHCSSSVTPWVRVVSAPAGGGKTSFSYAMMMAVTRYADAHPEAPYGCVFVVDQIKKADEVYKELNALMPGRVAVWSKEHDPACKERTRVPEPAAKFTKDELRLKPIAIVTHNFYTKGNGNKALIAHRNQRLHGPGRALVIVDEKPEDVETYRITLSDAQLVKEKLEDARPDLKDLLDKLALFLFVYTTNTTNNGLTRVSDHFAEPFIAEELNWFTSEEADRTLRDHGQKIPDLEQLLGYAKALTQGCAFAVNSNSVVHFVGWRPTGILRQGPGTMLLDATSDIDGISQICPSRVHVKVPQARYDNLEIIHVPQHTKRILSTYLESAANQFKYVDYMVEVIKANMKPGEHGLVVCKKKLVDQQRVPQWPARDTKYDKKESYTEDFGWNIDGRHLSVVYYGTGIGSNHWKRADVVFLFDDFHLRRSIGAANVQGLRGHKANEGALAGLSSLSRKSSVLELFLEGHRLRWTKQMALRGNGRNYDEHGLCGKQRLVISNDLKSFLANVPRLFPGAKDPVITDNGETSTRATRLLRILSASNLPSTLTTKDIGRLLGLKAPWFTVSHNILTPKFLISAKALGWEHVPGKGRKGSRFERNTIIRSAVA
jgi:hypothetical protein